MRFVSAVIVCMLAAWMLGLWLPYWSLSLSALAVGFLMRPGNGTAFLAGLLAGALLWGGLAYMADAANGHILATRVGKLLGTNAMGLVAITGLLGGVLAALGMLVGSRVREAVS